jgi:hypothetical protein
MNTVVAIVKKFFANARPISTDAYTKRVRDLIAETDTAAAEAFERGEVLLELSSDIALAAKHERNFAGQLGSLSTKLSGALAE